MSFRRPSGRGRLAETEFEQLGDAWELVALLDFIASAHMMLGRWDQAEECAKKSIRLASRLNHMTGLAVPLWLLSFLEGRIDPQYVLAETDKLIPKYEVLGDSFATCALLSTRGAAMRFLGDLKMADKLLCQAVNIGNNNDLYHEHTKWIETIMERMEQSSNLTEKQQYFKRLRRLFRKAWWVTRRFPIPFAEYRRLKACWLWELGSTQRAENLWNRLYSEHVKTGNVFWAARVLYSWGSGRR